MVFEQNSPVGAVDIERKSGENVMYVNFLGASFVPSVVDNSDVMARTVELLSENVNVSRIVFVQQRNYNYDSRETLLLGEIAKVWNFLSKIYFSFLLVLFL